MKVLKVLKYGAAVVLGLPVLFLLASGVINAFDEDLNPEIVALVKRAETDQIAQQNNAYFALRGLNAPSGEDIQVAGKAFHAQDQRRLDAFRKGGELKLEDPSSQPGALKFKGESMNLCILAQDYFYENGACKYQAETDRTLAENRELLQRYYQVLDYHLYEEPAIGYVWPAQDLLALLRLAHVDIERKLAQGLLDQAAALMVRNLAFWRDALDGKYRLVPEALFRVGYSVSQRSMSELLWRHPRLLDKADFKAALARPFAVNTDSLQAQLDREFMGTYLVTQGADLLFFEGSGRSQNPVLKWVANRLYRRNATLNDYYACMKHFYAVRTLSGAAYEKAVAEYRDYAIEDASSLAINPIGKITLYLGHCPKGSWLEEFYSERFEASRRLVTLEIELLKRKLPKTRYPAFLAAAPMGLRDPLTDQPAKWDAARQIIFFERHKGCFSEGHWVSLAPVPDFNRCRT